MEISGLFFYLFAAIAIAFSLLVILSKNPVTSALSLVLVFFAFAGVYAWLDAHLIAALQVLVYAGAIMVLFLFVIMLLDADKATFDLKKSGVASRFSACLLGGVLLGMLVWVFQTTKISGGGSAALNDLVTKAGGNTRALSQLLFSQYLLPFELTSALLLVGIVGSVILAKRKPSKKVLS